MLDEGEAKTPKGQEKSEMARPALIPVGEPDLMMFAIVLPLKFVLSTINETGFDRVPTWALPLSTSCAAGERIRR